MRNRSHSSFNSTGSFPFTLWSSLVIISPGRRLGFGSRAASRWLNKGQDKASPKIVEIKYSILSRKTKKQNLYYTATIYNLHLAFERTVRTKFNVSLELSWVLPSVFVSCLLHHFIYPRFSPLRKFQYLLTFGSSDMFVVLVTSSFFPRFYFFAHRYWVLDVWRRQHVFPPVKQQFCPFPRLAPVHFSRAFLLVF